MSFWVFLVTAGLEALIFRAYQREHLYLLRGGITLHEAIVPWATSRLRPVAMPGLFPAALSTSVGSETAKPFAVTIIGGLVAATLLTLTLLPLLYRYFEEKFRTEPPIFGSPP